MTDLTAQIRAASRRADRAVFGQARQSPAQQLRALADAAESLGVTEPDVYAEGGAVTRLETEVAELLGKPAAAFFPSGVMGQQSVLRVWCERRGSRRVALPDLSHLVLREEDGPRLLHDLRLEMLTTGRRVATAADLARHGEGLGAALVELPLRDAGCLLPTWDELVELSRAARAAGVPLHFDAARIWESQDHLGHGLADIAALADSVYVSFYKGLGGPAGACIAGPVDVIEESRVWRKRAGGTLFNLMPYAVGALAGLRDQLPRMGEFVAWARSLAAELEQRGIRVDPNPPHTNTFHVFAPGRPDQLNTRLLARIETDSVAWWPAWRATDVPGWSTSEVAVSGSAVGHDPAEVAQVVADLVG